jgi:serine/threonine-protein kinase
MVRQLKVGLALVITGIIGLSLATYVLGSTTFPAGDPILNVFVPLWILSIIILFSGVVLSGIGGYKQARRRLTKKRLISSPAAATGKTMSAELKRTEEEQKQPSRRSSSAPASNLLNNRYQEEKQLKIGGMAVISLAEDVQTDLLCIIKTPRTDTSHDPKINIDKLTMEAAYLRQFDHPNIVKYVDLFTHHNILHLVVDYVDGKDLLTAFAAKPAEESRVIKWAGQILDALEYVHRAGVVHRDLNPGNIMLRRDDDNVVIIDFGTLKPAAVDSGTVVSKPGFEVPEQITRGYSDVKSDLFGVGGILFYLLTSTAPGFIGSQDIVELLVTKGVTQQTAKCIEQALRITPAERFQSAAVMRRALCNK